MTNRMTRRMMKQVLTYWSPATYDEYGDQTFGSPVELTGRIEQHTELFIDTLGNEQASRSWVWVTTELETDGYIYEGRSSTTNPETVSGADKIRRIETTPDIKAREILYKAIL